MYKRDNVLLLEDIDEACAKIQTYVKGLDFDDFLKDDRTIDAVIRNFEIIGEAANRLSDDVLEQHHNVQWRQIIGLRNRLVHGYFGVDHQIIWQIIHDSLPVFKGQIREILEKHRQ